MKFFVDRASHSIRRNEQPCAGAEYVGQARGGWHLWQIEIASLEALMQFMRENGEDIIISETTIGAEGPLITIYDDHVE